MRTWLRAEEVATKYQSTSIPMRTYENEILSSILHYKLLISNDFSPLSATACNCFGHSNTCDYDENVDDQGLSLDIHGRFAGGGVCKNCEHNTEGINCNKCQSKFYRPHGKHWNETDVCRRKMTTICEILKKRFLIQLLHIFSLQLR